MTNKMLKNLLQEKKAAIVDRWLDAILASYPPETCAFFKQTKGRFSNPVGHALRVGTRAVFESLLRGERPDRACRHLEDIIKMRAIQEFSPSRAISFVFLLKEAVRGELREEAEEGRLSAELMEFDADVDQMALFAFDIYAGCRERVYQLRVNEAKRGVGVLMRRLNHGKRREDGSDSSRPDPLRGAAAPSTHPLADPRTDEHQGGDR